MTPSNPIQDWHQIAVELLMTDADLALQSITAFFAEDDQQAVARVVRNTREVYENILKKRAEVQLSEQEAALFDGKMERLRARLRFMGEPV